MERSVVDGCRPEVYTRKRFRQCFPSVIIILTSTRNCPAITPSLPSLREQYSHQVTPVTKHATALSKGCHTVVPGSRTSLWVKGLHRGCWSLSCWMHPWWTAQQLPSLPRRERHWPTWDCDQKPRDANRAELAGGRQSARLQQDHIESGHKCFYISRKAQKENWRQWQHRKQSLQKAARRGNESDNRKKIPLSWNHCDLDSQCMPIEISGTLVFKDTTRIIITNWVTDFVLTIISGYQPQPITPNLEDTWSSPPSSSSSSSSSSNKKVKCEINCLGSILSKID